MAEAGIISPSVEKSDEPTKVEKSLEKEDYVDSEKNKLTLSCIHCPSKIMTPMNATYYREDKKLPKMNQQKNCPELEMDLVSEWFVVDDMFTFENIGVSHSVEQIRYLSCADCEMGPVGWTDLNDKKCYVAIPRVRQS